jgi:glycosyltransferase involved in cell wall biosynthesis
MQQTILPSEIVIVDDKSTDDTVALIYELQGKFPIIKLFINNRNEGPVKSFRRALAICSSEYVALCDQDDIWECDKLQICLTTLQELEASSVPSIVYTDLKVVDSNGKLIAQSFWDLQGYHVDDVGFKDILIGNVVTGCTIMMNRPMKILIESMPESVPMHDHWIALIAFGIGKVKAIHKAPILYREHVTSVTNKSRMTYIERTKLLLKNLFDQEREYLKTNILQAERFQELYAGLLTESKRQALKDFVSLKHKSSFHRKIKVGLLKYANGK